MDKIAAGLLAMPVPKPPNKRTRPASPPPVSASRALSKKEKRLRVDHPEEILAAVRKSSGSKDEPRLTKDEVAQYWGFFASGHCTKPVFLELFAGSGRVTKKLIDAGHTCVPIDISHGLSHDLTNPALLERIEDWVAKGLVAGVYLSTPCSTWSVARRGVAGCKGGPLRTIEHILGHPESMTRPDDEAKIILGNRTMEATARIIRCCIRAGKPCALENPNSSRLWHAPPLAELSSHSLARTFKFDFCVFGSPWQKSTKILSWGCAACKFLEQRCGAKVCTTSGKPHVILQGSCHGKSLTALACPYPWKLAATIAEWLAQSAC